MTKGTEAARTGDGALIESVEAELSLFWRRSRAASNQFSKDVHSDLDPNAYGLLAVLYREGATRLTDLAATIGVGKPSISRQISLLQSLGLVAKASDPSDGRAQLIDLTPQGSRAIKASQAARKQALDALFASWPAEDLQDFSRLLAKFNQRAQLG